MKKNQRVRLYGNDDRRSIKVSIDDLHPASRIRATIQYDKKKKLFCNVSRDVIRSMVASQRHNRLLIKGDVTIEELTLELSRDCVSVITHQVDDTLPIFKLCARVAEAITTWPRLKRSMGNPNISSDYSVGPTHAILRIGRKPVFEGYLNQSRPCRELLRAFCKMNAGLSFANVKTMFPKEELRVWLSKQPLFWFNDYDDGEMFVSALHDDIKRDAEFTEVLVNEFKRHFHSYPNLDAVFERFGDHQHAVAVDILFAALERLGWSVRRISAETRKHAVVFPTAWVTNPRLNSASIDMLLQPPM